MVAQSITPGDRVGVYMNNCVQYIVLALGIWKAGAVLVPFKIAIPRAPLRHAVEDSGVRIVFTDTAGIGRFSGDCDGLDVARRVVHLPRTEVPSAGERPAARWS
ncbi:AMP-binding protein [Rhodococcus pseudokoreensis]|uniref:AMP-binding protein n=2 Tax=Rhodococcus pseudokoreensis TaxID=2811421 RepID=A0A974W7T1_9NOCA|nr:AMP-binding protein [Rhodococcus pseudokoreensis]QSE92716.1 AMP-binding protein [Rhodococcus pseudokoreensis]